MKNIKLKKWDVVEHLKTEEDMANYLEACFAEGDAALITASLGDIARARGMSQVVRDAGLFSDEDKRIEFATIMKVFKVMGLKMHAQFA